MNILSAVSMKRDFRAASSSIDFDFLLSHLVNGITRCNAWHARAPPTQAYSTMVVNASAMDVKRFLGFDSIISRLVLPGLGIASTSAMSGYLRAASSGIIIIGTPPTTHAPYATFSTRSSGRTCTVVR